MAYRLSKWDKEILSDVTHKKTSEQKKEFLQSYKEMRSKGRSPEQILDFWSGQTADTRWIYCLPHSPEMRRKKLKQVM